MKEELEEGHFDKDGNYYFNKDDQLKDAWLDNIDWEKVHKKDDDKSNSSEVDSEDDLPEAGQENRLIELYEQIITFLKEGENIAKALQRLGHKKKRISTAERLKQRKLGTTGEINDAAMASFLKLTELSNEVLGTGNMDIYEETFEMVALKLQKSKKEDKSPSVDMFGDNEPDISIKEKDIKDTIDKVEWEFKASDAENVHGPFSTEKMVELQECGELKAAQVRKLCQTSWYDGSRMDFSIYL